MDKKSTPPPKTSVLASTWRRLKGRADRRPALADLPCIPVSADHVATLTGPVAFRETLLALIAQARERILVATLYLQDDDAGREVLSALYAAKAARPELEIAVFVDWHRAQRGLVGESRSPGNAALYRAMALRLGPGVPVYGVPVQTREMMGVMHLKGFILDDTVLYSGASLNEVYLHRNERYRLDRYHVFQDRHLADSLAGLLLHVILPSPAVHALDSDVAPRTASLRAPIVKFRRVLAKTRYHYAEGTIRSGEVGITPLLGLGGRDNELNAVLLKLVRQARDHLILFTPYFNLPGPLRRGIDAKIKEGCKVTIVLGDKVANDFYIPPEEPFKTIGALPYLYEGNLRRFCKTHQVAIDRGLLNVHSWRHEHHTFHLKGLLVDDDYALLTGHNMNPRAWRMDLENGLLVHDPHKLLRDRNQAELERIVAHTRRLDHYGSLEAIEAYPAPVRRLLKRLAHARMDRLVNHVL
ncbi:MAG TPA: CDP-diacylglycerol--serine O-phosphatidyltransferase [Usitatibacteraceae bacterium]|nr:CDP-diacylglycerol--serine O-phosphatidyltransferase [Usitatibacteraceae bacterium]